MNFLSKTQTRSPFLVMAYQPRPFLIQVLAGQAEYLKMFPNQEDGKPIVTFAMKSLKKNDIIVWFLNNMKKDPSLFTKELQEKTAHIQGMRETIPRLKSFTFNAKWTLEEGISEFQNAERQAQSDTIKKNRLVPAKGKILLKLDVADYAWWDLGVGACGDEAEAMGHCGNVPSEKSGDRVISLRREMDVSGQKFYEPHLTFILNHGFLGEMKGKANEKPKEKYHKAIVALLLSPAVKKIWGGGYEAHKNFEFSDLSPEEQKMILAKKPNIVIDKLKKIDEKDLPQKHKSDAKVHNKEIGYLEEELDGAPLNQEALDKIATNGSTIDARLAATSRVKNQDILKTIALNKKEDLNVREEAVRKLHDQPTLSALAMNFKRENPVDDRLSYVALFNLKDQNILEQVALDQNRFLEHRRLAISKIKNDKVLKEIALKGGSNVANDAVEKIENQADLKEVAMDTNVSDDARKTALSKIEDQEFFAKFVESDAANEGHGVKDYVVQYKIDDPKLLAKIALTPTKKAGARSEAIKKITDQDVLKKVAETDERDYNRKLAIEKIDDQEFLLKIVKDKDNTEAVRAAAVAKLTDQDLLKEIAQDQNEDLAGRIAAIKKVNDQDFILDFIKDFDSKEDTSNAKIERILDAAVFAVSDQKELEKIALNHPNRSARITATNQLENQKILKRIALKKDEDYFVRKTAISKLDDQPTLEKIAKSKLENVDLRLSAMEKLTNPDALDQIANRRTESSRYLTTRASELSRKLKKDKDEED